jgi:hypothetical protein
MWKSGLMPKHNTIPDNENEVDRVDERGEIKKKLVHGGF